MGSLMFNPYITIMTLMMFFFRARKPSELSKLTKKHENTNQRQFHTV